jgi:hypothetical protein
MRSISEKKDLLKPSIAHLTKINTNAKAVANEKTDFQNPL